MQATTSFSAFVRPLLIGRVGRNRPVLGAIVLGALVLGAVTATAWQWNWLAAIGVAPLLLGVAPCAAMCGLGLCMHRMSGRSCAPSSQVQPIQEPLENPSSIQET